MQLRVHRGFMIPSPFFCSSISLSSHPSTFSLLFFPRLQPEEMSTFYNSTDQFFHIDPTEVDDLQKCIWRLVCNATWLGTFSITFILFILLSTKRQRKSILFSIQCGLFILTIIYNSTALTNANSRFNMVWIEEEDQNKYWNFARLDVANLSLEHWITILADGSLLVHILGSFFPSDRFKNQQRLIYVLPFLIIMVARIIPIIHG